LKTPPDPLWIRLVLALVGLAPRALLPSLGAALGWFAGSVLRVRRKHVETSMKRAGVADVSRSAALMYRSLGVGLFELLWMSARPEEPPPYSLRLTKRAGDLLNEAFSLGRGVVVTTAHTGNWDLCACAVASFLRERSEAPARSLHVITKRMSWRSLDALWQRLRASRGVRLVDARGAMARVKEALARGDVVAMMIDQAPERRRGVMEAPFLGANARHDLAPLVMARRARAKVVVAFARRLENGEHELDVADVIEPEALGDLESAMRRIVGALERFVVEHPPQWMWLHRRWKGLRETNSKR